MNAMLLIGSDTKDVRDFRDHARRRTPHVAAGGRDSGGWDWADELEAWRDLEKFGCRPSTGSPSRCGAKQLIGSGPAIGLDPLGWETRGEQPLDPLGGSPGLCRLPLRRTDGSIVAVVDGPTTLECAGWAPETAVAEGVRAMSRSLALSEGVLAAIRVNTVSTPARLPARRARPSGSAAGDLPRAAGPGGRRRSAHVALARMRSA